jgi:hypothetical protein
MYDAFALTSSFAALSIISGMTGRDPFEEGVFAINAVWSTTFELIDAFDTFGNDTEYKAFLSNLIAAITAESITSGIERTTPNVGIAISRYVAVNIARALVL